MNTRFFVVVLCLPAILDNLGVVADSAYTCSNDSILIVHTKLATRNNDTDARCVHALPDDTVAYVKTNWTHANNMCSVWFDGLCPKFALGELHLPLPASAPWKNFDQDGEFWLKNRTHRRKCADYQLRWMRIGNETSRECVSEPHRKKAQILCCKYAKKNDEVLPTSIRGETTTVASTAGAGVAATSQPQQEKAPPIFTPGENSADTGAAGEAGQPQQQAGDVGQAASVANGVALAPPQQRSGQEANSLQLSGGYNIPPLSAGAPIAPPSGSAKLVGNVGQSDISAGQPAARYRGDPYPQFGIQYQRRVEDPGTPWWTYLLVCLAIAACGLLAVCVGARVAKRFEGNKSAPAGHGRRRGGGIEDEEMQEDDVNVELAIDDDEDLAFDAELVKRSTKKKAKRSKKKKSSKKKRSKSRRSIEREAEEQIL